MLTLRIKQNDLRSLCQWKQQQQQHKITLLHHNLYSWRDFDERNNQKMLCRFKGPHMASLNDDVWICTTPIISRIYTVHQGAFYYVAMFCDELTNNE